jgi:integrase/recombinase XerD
MVMEAKNMNINNGLMITGNELTRRGFNADLFARFIDYTSVKETTIKGYAVCIRHFAAWIKANGIVEPQRADIKAYKEHLDTWTSPKTGKGFSAGTRAQYLRACKHFFKWAASEGLYPNIADNIKGAKVRQDNTRKDPLQEQDVRRILNSIDTSTTQGKRNYAMFILAITGGLRIIEMQRANIEDIKTIAGERVLFIQGKGRDEKDEYKKLVPEVDERLQEYLATRPSAKKSEPLFTGTSNRAQNQRITEPSISRIIKDVLRGAGYDSDRLTAHSLRHTSVTLLLKSGATLQEAQHHARHADPATTGIYAHNLDRAKDHSEQRIYNQIFQQQPQNTEAQAAAILATLNATQQRAALDFLQALTA